MPEWPVGLSTGCFFNRPILSCLGLIRDAGFGLVEVCSYPPHLDYHDHEACARAGDRMRDLTLTPHSFHAPFADHIDITTLDAGARERAQEELLTAAGAAAALGARHFVIHPGPEKSGLPQHERRDRLQNAVAVLDRVAARCRELDLSLLLENMLPHLSSGSVHDLLWLLGAMAQTGAGICLDTGHAFLAGDLQGVMHSLSGHLRLVHASDNRRTFDDHLPPGAGDIDWPLFVRQLGEHRFQGAIMLEIAGRGEPDEILRGAQRGRDLLLTLAREL